MKRSPAHKSSRSTSRRRSRRFEQLETRRMLTTIQWENRGSADNDSDGFVAAFADQAETARALVDDAISDWQDVIQNSPAGDQFSLHINAADLAKTNPYSQCVSADGDFSDTLAYACHFHDDIVDKIPTGAHLAVDNNAADKDWYFGFGDEAGSDFYSAIAHELGHALGLATDERLKLSEYLSTPETEGSESEDEELLEFSHNGVIATFTTDGHLFEGDHAGDLLNPGRAHSPVNRSFISDLDAEVLEAAYGYEVTLPSTEDVSVTLEGGRMTILGSEGADQVWIFKVGENLWVFSQSKLIAEFDLASVDEIHAYLKGGDDSMYVWTGIEVPVGVDAGGGKDSVLTSDGDDFLIGGGGDDTLESGSGNDWFYGGAGTNRLTGSTGDDTYWFTADGSISFVNENEDAGTDVLDYSGLRDSYSVHVDLEQGVTVEGAGSLFFGAKISAGDTITQAVIFSTGMEANIENILGGEGDDTLSGNALANIIRGGSGNDVIRGGDGADHLYGDTGSDQLFGDDGNDYLNGGLDGSIDSLTGGAGADTFVRPMTIVQSYYYTYRRISYWNSFTRRMTYLYIPQRVYYTTYNYEDLVTDSSTEEGDSIRSW